MWFTSSYSLDAQAALRTVYAVFLLLQLAITLPGLKRFFASETYGGFVQGSKVRDRLYHPAVVYAVAVCWILGALGLLFDRCTLTSAVLAFIACRYLLIDIRWSSLSRGFGAVGHMTMWTNFAIVFLELSRIFDGPTGILRNTSVFVFRADFAMIMIMAGIYKLTAGYAANDGYQLALANPWWSFWSRFYSTLAPGNFLYRAMNHSAYFVEITAGALMLTPLREIGAGAIALSFGYLATQLRLAFLPGMVSGTYFLFVPAGGHVDMWLHMLFKAPAVTAAFVNTVPAEAIAILLWCYLAMVVIVRFGVCYNFYGHKRLPGQFQRINDLLANVFIVTIWRVFTANVVNFFIDVYLLNDDGTETHYEHIGWASWREQFRYAHAGEFVALCTTFTTLKYFPDNFELFQERLTRYAKTVRHEPNQRVAFVYTAIDVAENRFIFNPVTRFIADTAAGTITESTLVAGRDPRAAAASSTITYGAHPGSYAPG